MDMKDGFSEQLILNKRINIGAVFRGVALQNLSALIESICDATSQTKSFYFLIISSISLTIASGATTFFGIEEYTNATVAVFTTIGIQGLLFSTSWKLGHSFKNRETSASLMIIYLICLTVSVFFSYSSLFQRVYSDEERLMNRDTIARSVAMGIIPGIKRDISNSLVIAEKEIYNEEYRVWKSNILKISNNKVTSAQKDKQKYAQKSQSYQQEMKFEEDVGGTVFFDKSGNKKISARGRGDIYNGIKKSFDDSESESQYYKNLHDRLLSMKSEITPLFEAIESVPTKENILKLESKCIEFLTIEGSAKEEDKVSCYSNYENNNMAQKIIKRSQIVDSDKICENPSSETIYRGVLDIINKCLSAAIKAGVGASGANDAIKKLEREYGDKSHHSIRAISELMSGNWLSYISLSIAVVLDLLLLLCGILGERRDVFLTMRKPTDLDELGTYPLEVVMSASVNANSEDSEFISRAKSILEISELSVKHSIKDGCPAVISMEKAEEKGLQKEIGVLLSMNLAKPLQKNGEQEYNFIGLRTKLVLILCERISKEKLSARIKKIMEYNEKEGVK